MTRLERISAGILTLMTPEPTGGYYKTAGVESFVRKFGYPDMTGQANREDRLNFGGIHRVGLIIQELDWQLTCRDLIFMPGKYVMLLAA